MSRWSSARCCVWAWSLASLLLFSLTVVYAASEGGYRVIRKIAVGGDGAWDDLTVDPLAHRIYLSRSTHVMVLGEESGKVIGDIPDTKGVHGIALAPEFDRGYATDGGEAMVTVFDLKTLKPIMKVNTTGEAPDGIIYDPRTKRIFAFNHRSGNATAIDARTGQVVGTVETGESPESAVLDDKGNLFLTLENKDTLVEFDTRTLKVENTWPTAPCKGPGPIAMDRVHRRLFLNCQPNKMMALMDADTGKVVSTAPIGGQVDGIGFDPSSGLAFASCGEGVLNVIHEDSPDKLNVVETVKTQVPRDGVPLAFGPRTMATDPKTHHMFVVTADFIPAAAPTAENPRPRPQMVPNSFVILEIAK
jgi:DNA-binding beta-propeller fold protein YncE